MAEAPPPHVAAAAAVVDQWLKSRPPIVATAAPAVKEQSAAEKFRAYRLAQVEPPQKG
jgi:hypothetical protein